MLFHTSNINSKDGNVEETYKHNKHWIYLLVGIYIHSVA